MDQNPFPARKQSIRAPEFPEGLEWLNIDYPLTFKEDLKGKFVLLDFWTFCCINCIHVMPDLAYLEEKFANEPFVVVGVHSAKFENEQETESIRQAIMRYEVGHPVVNDANMTVWRNFSVSSWPTLVLVDPEGYVVWGAPGEGHRDTLEKLLQQGLEYYGKQGKLINSPLRFKRETRESHPLAYPGKLAIDSNNRHLFISDSNHNRIVVTDLEGNFIESIGNGSIGFSDGDYENVQFNRLQGLVFHDGNLLVADAENHAIRRVNLKTKQVETIVGTGEQSKNYAKGSGKGRDVPISTPWDLCIVDDTLFIAMAGTHQIWIYDLKKDYIQPFAGTGQEARLDGPKEHSAFAQPTGITSDGKHLFISDSEISCVREIDLKSGLVRTIAGGDLFEFGDVDGIGDGARLQHCQGVLYTHDTLYLADTYNHKIKTVDRETREVKTYLEDSFREPSGFATFENNLFVADTNNHAIKVINLKDNSVSKLDLKGVPRPKDTSISETGGGKPTELPTVTISPGKGEIHLEINLPEGHSLTSSAPSSFTLKPPFPIQVEQLKGHINTNRVTIPFTATKGQGSLSLFARIYHCEKNGLCQFRSVSWRVPVEVKEGGETVIKITSA